MTVSALNTRNDITATSGQATFTYTFMVLAATDMTVYQNGVLLSSGSYTVNGVGVTSGGTVVLNTGALTGQVVSLVLAMPLDRTTDYQNSGDFLASDVNADFDKIYIGAIQNENWIDRGLRLQEVEPTPTSPANMDLPLKATRLGRLLGFTTDTGVPVMGPLITDVLDGLSLKSTLDNGNITGGTNINVTSGDGITTLVSGITINSFLDEDNMVSNSATALATQQSIKTYVDAQVPPTETLANTLLAGNSSGSSNIVMADSQNIQFGSSASENIKISHDGTNGLIKEIGSGGLQIQGEYLQIRGDDGVSGMTISPTAGQTWDDISFQTGLGGSVKLYIDDNGIALQSGVFVKSIETNTSLGTSNTTLSTTGAIKAYVDGQVGTVDTLSEVLTNGNTTSGNDIDFADNDKAKFGNSSDLQIYHDGTASRIGDVGTGDLIIQATNLDIADAVTGENILTAVSNGAIKLYYDNVSKIETTATGIDVSGLVEFDSLSGTGTVAITNILDEDNMASNSATALATQQSIKAYVDDQVGTVDTLSEVLAIGNTTSGNNIDFADNDRARFGNSGDLRIYHDGTDSRIVGATPGYLIIQGSNLTLADYTTGEDFLTAVSNGRVTIFYDGAEKLVTTATGIGVTGELTATTATLTYSGVGDCLVLESTDTGTSAAPDLVLYRNSTSPADGDDLGAIIVKGKDDAGNDTSYIFIKSEIADASNGNEASNLFFNTMSGGGLGARLAIEGSTVKIGVGSDFVTNTAGTNNFRAGVNAGNSIASGGIQNTLVGDEAGTAVTTGDYNVALGNYALSSEISGNRSTAIGRSALESQNVTSSINAYNVAVGMNAGATVTTGVNNTLIGSLSNVSASGVDDANVFGYAVSGDAGYTTLGNGADDIRAAHGNVTWATVSDERYKKDIVDSETGLSFINALRPRTFKYKTIGELPETFRAYEADSTEVFKNANTNHGFIAQEIKAAIDADNSVADGFKLWDDREDGSQEVAEAALIPILVKAIQELTARIKLLEE